MPKRLLIAMLCTALVPSVVAQVRGGFGHSGFHSRLGFAGHHGRGFGDGLVFLGDPFLYTDYPSESLTYETPSPPVVIVQPATVAPAPPELRSEPLMIEWQGDRYVRFGGQHESSEIAFPDYSEISSATIPASRAAHIAPGNQLPPAVLVYRDGHREEVLDYVIASGTMYARTDYWQSGSWTRNIQLSALDLPATIKTNQESGVRFVLPSGPNEVVTRP